MCCPEDLIFVPLLSSTIPPVKVRINFQEPVLKGNPAIYVEPVFSKLLHLSLHNQICCRKHGHQISSRSSNFTHLAPFLVQFQSPHPILQQKSTPQTLLSQQNTFTGLQVQKSGSHICTSVECTPPPPVKSWIGQRSGGKISSLS